MLDSLQSRIGVAAVVIIAAAIVMIVVLPYTGSNERPSSGNPNDGRKYAIDYSFSEGEGKVVQIEVNDETKAMSLALVTPEKSRFTITMPSFLYNYLFVNNVNGAWQLEAFVDGKSTRLMYLVTMKYAMSHL